MQATTHWNPYTFITLIIRSCVVYVICTICKLLRIHIEGLYMQYVYLLYIFYYQPLTCLTCKHTRTQSRNRATTTNMALDLSQNARCYLDDDKTLTVRLEIVALSTRYARGGSSSELANQLPQQNTQNIYHHIICIYAHAYTNIPSSLAVLWSLILESASVLRVIAQHTAKFSGLYRFRM